MKPISDLQIFIEASFRAATQTRLDFIAGRMTEPEFRAKRARQEATHDRRFNDLLQRRFPNYKPQEPRT